MGVDLNWGLANQSPNIAGGFIQSYEAGKQMGRQQRRDNALAAFAANPQDPNSVNALMSVDPESAMRLQQYQRQEQLRSGLSQAYDPATGHIDPVKARSAYLSAGDVDGAVQFDMHQRQQQLAQLDALHKVNEYGLQLLGGVTDQVSYDQAKAAAKSLYEQYGVPFPELPPVYNPGVVRALQIRSLSAKEQIEAALNREKFDWQKKHEANQDRIAAGNLAVSEGRLGVARDTLEAAKQGKITLFPGNEDLAGYR